MGKTFGTLILAGLMAIICTPAMAQITTLDDMDAPGNPPVNWTAFRAVWGATAVVEGATTHIGRTCTSMYMPGTGGPGPGGSTIIVRGFPIKPGAGPGHVYADLAVPSTFITHWIEAGYCIYETDPGAATAALHFDGMPGYPGGSGHDNATNTGWRNIIKFDGFGTPGLQTGNGDTWTTYSSADAGPTQGALVTAATESIIYIGFKTGNSAVYTGPVYFDQVRMDTLLVPPAPPAAAIQGKEWSLYR